jgi:hypothetical protein
LKDVPRDSAGQYEWTRVALGFHDVASKSAESEEFADLRPGDLMFWSGTYETHRAGVAVSHVMLYLGTEKKTGKRVMFGASDGRSYNGVQRFGVSVFDFKMPRLEDTKTDFLGYGRIPGYPSGMIAATAPAIQAAEKDKEEEKAKIAKTAQKPESAEETGAVAEKHTAKSKTMKSKSKTQAAKGETGEGQSEGQKSKSESQTSKTGAQKPKAETDELQPEAQKAKTQTRKSQSEDAKAKTEAEESASDASDSKPKSPRSKGGFQKAKEKTEEGASGGEKSKPQTPKPKSRTKAKQSATRSEE